VVEGPAGIGKSRLLGEARDAARERGLATLTARGGELERDYPYGLVRQLFERALRDTAPDRREELLSDAAELAGPALGLGSESIPTGGDASFAAVHGLYWLVSNLAADGPVVLIVDDLHWGDSPSLRFVHYLVPRLEGLPVLVLAATRPAEPGADPLVARAMAEPAATRLRPGPLSVDGVASIVAERFGDGADLTFAAACHSATGGNPFLLTELIEALIRDGVAPDVEGTKRVLELGPETVSRSIFLRLTRLPADSGRLAQAVAVLGSAPQLRDAAALAELDMDAAAAAADALAAVHILDSKESLRFVHPVVRQAVYSELPPAERASLHARAAEVLRQSGAPAQELATHLLAAPACGSEIAVATLRKAAAGALEQGAADLACRFLERASAEPPSEDERTDVLAELGWAEWLAFEDPPGAIVHLQQAYEGTDDPAERAERLLRLARATFSTGQIADAYDHLERGLDDLSGKVDDDTLLRLEAETASVGLVVPPTIPRATERLERFVGMEGASPAELLQIANLGAWEWLDGNAADAGGLAERALADGKLVEAEGSDSIMIYEAIWVLIWADRHELAAEGLRRTYAAARASGSVFGLCTSLALRTILDWRRGDLARAESDARNALGFPGVPAFVWTPAHTYLGLALIERGELDEAERLLELAGTGPGLPELVHFNAAFYARGQLRLHQGRVEEALEDFHELGARDARLNIKNPSIPWRCGAVEALVRLGRSDEAAALADQHRELADAWGAPSGIGVALWAQGLARGADGLDFLSEAAEVLAAAPARLDHAYALVDLGAATRRAGRRAEARDPLRQGLEAARRCGATELVELAHEELIAAGAKPRRLQFSGLDSLTASERRVSQLAARGLTNREIAQELFVTQKTVENHLTRVYSKLDIDSRDKLAAALEGGE
jgi:DNA-binding CsgD family transcriptional regulator